MTQIAQMKAFQQYPELHRNLFCETFPVLSVQEPWASLIVGGWKPMENRTWPPSPSQLRPGDWLCVHASKKLDMPKNPAAREEDWLWMRDKAADEAHRREAQEMQAVAKASMARDYRLRLGNEAKGKSDDEVIRLYREKEIAAGRTP